MVPREGGLTKPRLSHAGAWRPLPPNKYSSVANVERAPEPGLWACCVPHSVVLLLISVPGATWFPLLCADIAGYLFLTLLGGFLLCPTLVQVHSLKLALEGVEKERDFYFGKLREIELLCQEHGQENDDLVQRLMEVLYASDEQVGVRSPRLLASERSSLIQSAAHPCILNGSPKS